jgi:hypothetical protein
MNKRMVRAYELKKEKELAAKAAKLMVEGKITQGYQILKKDFEKTRYGQSTLRKCGLHSTGGSEYGLAIAANIGKLVKGTHAKRYKSQIIALATDGVPNAEAAQALQVSKAQVRKAKEKHEAGGNLGILHCNYPENVQREKVCAAEHKLICDFFLSKTDVLSGTGPSAQRVLRMSKSELMWQWYASYPKLLRDVARAGGEGITLKPAFKNKLKQAQSKASQISDTEEYELRYLIAKKRYQIRLEENRRLKANSQKATPAHANGSLTKEKADLERLLQKMLAMYSLHKDRELAPVVWRVFRDPESKWRGYRCASAGTLTTATFT